MAEARNCRCMAASRLSLGNKEQEVKQDIMRE